ncbi:MAG: hypothetical protein R6W68_11385 [Ignavibacteriaceae bacterium]
MIKLKKYTLSILIFLFILNRSALIPCTTAVVSGNATDDGRPLLLKHRDASELQNRLVYFADGNFKFIGLVNSPDKNNDEVWVGFNEAGFGIMNSASYNLKSSDDTTKIADLEGIIMKMALDKCATVDDFENLLRDLPKPLGVEANFGVIDAMGGAAYFETSNFDFIKYDVNDPDVAPEGYLIRTNYSFAGNENKGFGYIRYATAAGLFENQTKDGKISFEFLIKDVPRCLVHSFTNTYLAENIPESIDDTVYVYFRDYIPRYSTSAAIVVQGIKENESPSLTTMWTILGFPLTSVIVPLWITDDGSLPSILIADETGNAPLCNLALQLKDKVFSSQNDARENYLNISALMNKENSGVYQKLIPIEEQIMMRTKEILEQWRESGMKFSEVKEFFNWLDENVIPLIESQFR